MNSIAKIPGIENVLLIVADMWRGDHLRATGHPLLDLPHLESLAAEGVTFTRHFTQAAPCGPARTSLLTGQYMMTHRVVQNSTPLNADFTNIALETRQAGYDPSLIGFTTTTPDPRRTSSNDPRFFILGDVMEGWREVTSFSNDNNPYIGYLRRIGIEAPLGHDTFWEPKEGPLGPSVSPSKVPAHLSDTAWLTNIGLDYLHTRLGSKWFLHLGFYRPHPPYISPDPYHEMFDPANLPRAVRANSKEIEAEAHPLLDYYINSISQEGFFVGSKGLAADLTEEDIQITRAAYCGMIKEIDKHLERVFAFLKDTGQWDKTLIIFTSDHGDQLGDHFLFGKVGYFDESFHIPLIVRDPRPEADPGRGRIVKNFTEHVDLMPTILNWIGLPIPRQCDGRSLLPFCRNETPADWREQVHYEYDFRNCVTQQPQEMLGLKMDDCNLAVLQDEHFKYVHFTALPPLFFDLEKDPNQFTNVADDPTYASKVLSYAQDMLSWRMRHADRRLTGFSASPDGLVSRT